MTYIQGTPMGVQAYLACVCFLRACVGVQKERLHVRVSVSLCVPSDAQLCVGSCVPPLSFRRNLFVVLAFSFLSSSISPSVCQENKNRQMPRKCVSDLILLILRLHSCHLRICIPLVNCISYTSDLRSDYNYQLAKWGVTNISKFPNSNILIDTFSIHGLLYIQYVNIDFSVNQANSPVS